MGRLARPSGGDEQREKASSFRDALLRALGELSTSGVVLGADPDVVAVATAIYWELGGETERVDEFVGRLQATPSGELLLKSDSVVATGVCVRGCPPDEPAPARSYTDEAGTSTICDHVPPHSW